MQRRKPPPNRRPAPQSPRRFNPSIKTTKPAGRMPAARPLPQRTRGQR